MNRTKAHTFQKTRTKADKNGHPPHKSALTEQEISVLAQTESHDPHSPDQADATSTATKENVTVENSEPLKKREQKRA